MASPFTAYFAGMGTLAAVLALGFSTAVMLTDPSPSVQRRAETKVERPAERAPADPLAVNPAIAASPVITAAQTPRISTHFAVPPPLWPPAPSTTGQSSEERPELAADPGMLQIPVRPATPVEAAPAQVTSPAARPREAVRNPDTADPVSGEWKKKEKKNNYAQRKQRRITTRRESSADRLSSGKKLSSKPAPPQAMRPSREARSASSICSSAEISRVG